MYNTSGLHWFCAGIRNKIHYHNQICVIFKVQNGLLSRRTALFDFFFFFLKIQRSHIAHRTRIISCRTAVADAKSGHYQRTPFRAQLSGPLEYTKTPKKFRTQKTAPPVTAPPVAGCRGFRRVTPDIIYFT